VFLSKRGGQTPAAFLRQRRWKTIQEFVVFCKHPGIEHPGIDPCLFLLTEDAGRVYTFPCVHDVSAFFWTGKE
jgi:hypothetical protein